MRGHVRFNYEWLKEFVNQTGLAETGPLHPILIASGVVALGFHWYVISVLALFLPVIIIGGGLIIATKNYPLFLPKEPERLPPPSPEVLEIMRELDEELGITDDKIVTPNSPAVIKADAEFNLKKARAAVKHHKQTRRANKYYNNYSGSWEDNI